MENEVELKVVMYHWLVVGLTLISFLNVALMIIRLGDWQTEWWVATGLTIIIAIDYGIRLIKAKNRKSFLITSAFDLLVLLFFDWLGWLELSGITICFVSLVSLANGPVIFTDLCTIRDLFTYLQLVLRLLV